LDQPLIGCNRLWYAAMKIVIAGSTSVQLREGNSLFRHDFAWLPRYPSYREGLDQVVSAWRD
jgi:hypothetical protein